MDKNHDVDHLLGHFDQPHTFKLPDFEWDDNDVPTEQEIATETNSYERFTRGAAARYDRLIEVPLITRRGVCWVLAWASALAVIGIAATILIGFTNVLAAERALQRAAQAGALEATLPRANYQSILATVERRLANYPSLADHLQLSLQQNGVLVQSQFHQFEGDQVLVSLSVPRSAASSNWLQAWIKERGDTTIKACAKRQIPGRKLAHGVRYE